jgi:hypothetical protein
LLAKNEEGVIVSSREERLAQNEAMFREVNEQVEARTGHEPGEPLTILCECASPQCATRLTLSPDEYAAVRSDPRQFAVVPGHEYLELEAVVSRNDRYEVVKKTGVAAEIAEAADDPSPHDEQA